MQWFLEDMLFNHMAIKLMLQVFHINLLAKILCYSALVFHMTKNLPVCDTRFFCHMKTYKCNMVFCQMTVFSSTLCRYLFDIYIPPKMFIRRHLRISRI